MRMLNFSIWTFSNPTWLLSRSSTGLLNYKTTYSCALPLTKLTLSDKLQDLLCCCSLLSPLTLRDHGRLQRHVNPNTGDLWDWSEGAQGCTQQKKFLVVFFPGSSPIWENIFGVTFWRRTPCDSFSPATQTWQAPVWQWEMLLGMPLCCWRPGSGKGMKSPIYHLPHLLVTGPNLTSKAYFSNLIPALVLWFLAGPVFYVLCSNSLDCLQRVGHWDWDET